MDGSCANSDLFCGAFLKDLASSFGRCENQDRSLFSRVFRALTPSKDRNAVIETIITAVEAYISSQKISHTMSSMDFLWFLPEMRMRAMMIIKPLRHKKMPRRIFCWRLILIFQSKVKGIEMTTWRSQSFRGLLIDRLTKHVGHDVYNIWYHRQSNDPSGPTIHALHCCA